MRKLLFQFAGAISANSVFVSDLLAHNCYGGVEDCLRTGGFLAGAAAAGAIAGGISALYGGAGDEPGVDDEVVPPPKPNAATGAPPKPAGDAEEVDISDKLKDAIFGGEGTDKPGSGKEPADADVPNEAISRRRLPPDRPLGEEPPGDRGPAQ